MAPRCGALQRPHDARVRDTGPWIAQFTRRTEPRQPSQWTPTNYGLHGTVFVYYSPDVYRWMQERDAALREGRDLSTLRPITDGSMILKLMLAGEHNETAADFPDITQPPPSPITFMVKDAQGSKDGWFWGVADPGTPDKPQYQIDWPPPANFPFPWMEAGNYCVNCHASARTAPQRTRVHHLPVFRHEDGITRVSQPRFYFPDTAFLEVFHATLFKPMVNIVADMTLHMPPESYDHVVASATGPAQFLTSDQCVRDAMRQVRLAYAST